MQFYKFLNKQTLIKQLQLEAIFTHINQKGKGNNNKKASHQMQLILQHIMICYHIMINQTSLTNKKVTKKVESC